MAYRTKRRESSAVYSILTGLGISWCITIISAIVITILVTGEYIPEDGYKTAAVITIILASVISALAIGKTQKEKKMLLCVAGGAMYYATLVACNAIFFGGQYAGLLGALLTIMGCTLVSSLLLRGQKRQRPTYMKGLRK